VVQCLDGGLLVHTQHHRALNAVDGTVIGSCMDKHRHEEFLKFLRTVDKEVPKGLAVHMILDNYATHKHKDVKAWPSS
jgi:hypothetical protein